MASRLRRRWTDRGAATAELVLVVPLLMVLLLCIVQFALAAHAQHIAQTAASRALAAARAQDGSAAAGHARAAATLHLLGGRVLTQPTVNVARGARSVAVEVHGGVLMVVPGLHLSVAGHAAGPSERWTR
ncbi:TadE/TadG family type IV pilus assembly protein [Streptomyces sp. NBC_01431]|uniref:TadE/TadG family type IV pilus assembly protein n=1 Tax=Streptomyces sp. NBC_01431 TaxID=2903863 RepID=UPI002E346009|nr:TadE/TadG family type IV pilus assembly protein [Streptomyces sp. NBC_01431]